jgi:hypothetical protein
MSIPPWLFDELADGDDDDADLVARATAWNELLAGAEEVDQSRVERDDRGDLVAIDGVPCWRVEDIARDEDEPIVEYQRRLEGPPSVVENVTIRLTVRQAEILLGRNTLPRMPDEDEAHYVRPARAAEMTGLSTTALAALRRRGRIRSIGMTAGEYARAR